MSTRNLYLSNISMEEAHSRFQDAIKPYLKMGTELIDVVDSLDRVTSEAVFALNNSPLYDSAAMDGIAVISSHTHGANENSPIVLKMGEDYMPIDTGDPVKPPYDAVIMAEDIQEADDDTVLIRSAAAAWQHVRPVGEDIVQGEIILPGSHKIRPIDIGMLLSGGITRLSVRKRLKVAIIPTGSELVEPGGEMKEGGIIESNSRMFEAQVRNCGADPTRFTIVPDDYDIIKKRISDAATDYDMLIVCSGTSAGREDYAVHVLRELGEVLVHGVTMKPGKPVILAVVNGKPVVGIPGYPVSAYLVFETFVSPVLRSASGHAEKGFPIVKARLTKRLVSSLKYKEYVRVKLGLIGDKLIASPLARGAGAAMSLIRADGFCVIDQDVEGLEAGAEVSVLPGHSLDGLERTLVIIGSHDLILDVLADLMPAIMPGQRLSSTHVGSLGGLMALKNGEAHLAPIHLLDEETGVYNMPVIKKLFGGREMVLIKGVGRLQGIMVKKGNPLGVKGMEDLPKTRYVNRQRGAGTRVLFDYKLKSLGIDPSVISGYDREAATHMAVAAAVRSESADAGLGVLSAAKAMGLDFIPVCDEEYDFAVPAELLELQPVQSFISMLKNPAFQKKLDALGGYSYENLGEIVY
jgi:putative molybdopterin biosynthesis protein